MPSSRAKPHFSQAVTKVIGPVFVFLLSALSPHVTLAEEDARSKIEQIIEACRGQQRRDQICQAFVDLRQVGDDAIEAIKLYARMSPQEYAILTLANMIATGRFRFRTKSQFFSEGRDVYDIRKDSFVYIYERDF